MGSRIWRATESRQSEAPLGQILHLELCRFAGTATILSDILTAHARTAATNVIAAAPSHRLRQLLPPLLHVCAYAATTTLAATALLG